MQSSQLGQFCFFFVVVVLSLLGFFLRELGGFGI